MAGGHSADDEVTEIHGDADIDPPKKAVLEVSSGEEDVEEFILMSLLKQLSLGYVLVRVSAMRACWRDLNE